MSDGIETQWSSNEVLEDLLGKPALIKGEDEKQYWRLHETIKNEMKPKNFFDQIRVRELTDRLWEMRRNKNSMAALVETSFVRALTELLRQSMPPDSELNLDLVSDPAADAARDYFDGATGPKRRKEIDALLAQYGITQAQVRAKAMELCGPSLLFFKKFDYRDDKLIRRSLKDHERRTAGKTKEKSNTDPEEVS
jgi:hypothetical protein